MCKKPFAPKSAFALTCSPRCRKIKSRSRPETLTIPGMEVRPDLEVPRRANRKRKTR